MMKVLGEVFTYIKKNPVLIVILAAGWLVTWSLLFPINGNLGHDVYWHLALVEVAFKHIPFQVPIFSGAPLHGYNYLIDLFMYFFTRFGIPSIYVYFVVIPFLYLTALTFLVILFAIRQNKSIYYVGALTFFIFLATPFSYLLSFYRRGSFFFGFNYPTAMQSSTALGNISYAYTVLLVFAALLIFQKRTQVIKDKLILAVLIGIAFGLKFYGGVILLFMVLLHELFLFIKERNWLKSFLAVSFIGVSVLLSVLFFYDPFSSLKSGGIFAVSPLAFPHNLIEDPDALYIPQLVMARYALYAGHKFSIRLVLIESITVLIYLVYNFGTRLIGLTYIIFQILRRKMTRLELTLLSTVCISVILALTLIQKGGDWWNTVQFFGYGLLLFNFFVASMIYRLFKWNKTKAIVITAVIFLLTMPLNIELVMKAADRISHPYDISKNEQNALAFLRKQKDGAVFALPVFEEWSYVPARSGKPVFYADENVMSNLGIQFQTRKTMLQNLKDIDVDKLPVKYFYLLKNDKSYGLMMDKLKRKRARTVRIYENPEVVIFKKQ